MQKINAELVGNFCHLSYAVWNTFIHLMMRVYNVVAVAFLINLVRTSAISLKSSSLRCMSFAMFEKYACEECGENVKSALTTRHLACQVGRVK